MSMALNLDLLWHYLLLRSFDIIYGDYSIFKCTDCHFFSEIQVLLSDDVFEKGWSQHQIPASYQCKYPCGILFTLVWECLGTILAQICSCCDPRTKFSNRKFLSTFMASAIILTQNWWPNQTIWLILSMVSSVLKVEGTH